MRVFGNSICRAFTTWKNYVKCFILYGYTGLQVLFIFRVPSAKSCRWDLRIKIFIMKATSQNLYQRTLGYARSIEDRRSSIWNAFGRQNYNPVRFKIMNIRFNVSHSTWTWTNVIKVKTKPRPLYFLLCNSRYITLY